MRVELWLKETSQPIVHGSTTNTYTKGPFWCAYVAAENRVYKYPVADIWRVVEEYYPESEE